MQPFFTEVTHLKQMNTTFQECLPFDYIVVGAGLSGLQTACYLSHLGRVAILTSGSLQSSNSYHAQGGIAAVMDASDSMEAHSMDTIEAGAYLCDRTCVDILTHEAPHCIDELMLKGMQFDRLEGRLALGLEGGHHHKRILHAGGDATGRKLTEFMIAQVMRNEQIKIFSQHSLVELLVRQGKCIGATFYNEVTQKMLALTGKATILACGGAAALYSPTTNPPTTVGEGIAIAHAAGAAIRDMEFVQFHPTALAVEGAPPFLISEAVRGEGAYLLNQKGQRFMEGVHPLKELAPRSVVARAIFQEMEREQSKSVWLSLQHLDAAYMKQRFPTITEALAQWHITFTERVAVAPAAHYTVGGVLVNQHGATSLPQLFAVGEVSSTGVMGANRLASNSLIECLVFARRIADYLQQHPSSAPSAAQCKALTSSYHLQPQQKRDSQEQQLSRQLGQLLSKKVGIERHASALKEALQEIEEVLNSLSESRFTDIHAMHLFNQYKVAQLIVRSAEARHESRGGHYRIDFPHTLPQTDTYHTIIENNQLTHNGITNCNPRRKSYRPRH